MDPDTTALICPVPRVASLLSPWRDRYDPSAAAGYPPHVTVLAPFLPPRQVTSVDLERLRELCGRVRPFTVDLAEVGVFDEDVLHLRPDPDEPFHELTEQVRAAFPRVEPYDGRFDELVPHVTVGHGIPRPQARQAARSLLLALPVRVHVGVVQLWVPGPDGWRAGVSFPLGTEVLAGA